MTGDPHSEPLTEQAMEKAHARLRPLLGFGPYTLGPAEQKRFDEAGEILRSLVRDVVGPVEKERDAATDMCAGLQVEMNRWQDQAEASEASAEELRRERDEARAHVANHHLEACESCIAVETARTAAEQELEDTLLVWTQDRTAHGLCEKHGPSKSRVLTGCWGCSREEETAALAAAEASAQRLTEALRKTGHGKAGTCEWGYDYGKPCPGCAALDEAQKVKP